MSAGLKTIKSYSLDTEQIYWKNLKNNLIYIFYITRKEKEFFYTNFKNSKLMFFYLFLKYLCGKTRACEFQSSFIRDCFGIKFRQDLTERFLAPLTKANLIKATYNASSHKWHIKLQDESKFNMFSTDLSVTNFIKKEFKDCEFFIPHGIYGFISYHKGILTFKGNHKYTLKRICEENISSTPNNKLITELRIALDSKKCKIRRDRKVKENNGMKSNKTNKDYGVEHIKDDVLEIIKEKLAEVNIEHITAENPVNIINNAYKKPTQIIQPHEFITNQWNKEIFKKSYFKGSTIIMENKKEITGIYNVTQNNKSATPIKTDIELIEDAVIEQVIMYVKGYHNLERNRGLGAEHIKLHLEKNSEGEINLEELLNLGQSIREYIKIFKKPFIDDKGAKVYEWENDKSVRFRVIVDKQKGGPQLPLSPSTEQIITFYSDRNLNEKMKFKNKEVEAFYKNNTKGENNMAYIETYKVTTEKYGGGDRKVNYFSINDMCDSLEKSSHFFIMDVETIKDHLKDYCDDENTIEAIKNNEKLNATQEEDKKVLLSDFSLELEAILAGADYLTTYRDKHSFIKENEYDDFIKQCFINDCDSDSYKCQISDEIYEFDKHIGIDNRANCIDDEVNNKSQQKPQTPKQLKQEPKKEPYRGR